MPLSAQTQTLIRRASARRFTYHPLSALSALLVLNRAAAFHPSSQGARFPFARPKLIGAKAALDGWHRIGYRSVLRFQSAVSQSSLSPPRVFSFGECPEEFKDDRVFSCVSYNVLLPNSEDGWWIYKYYRNSSEAHTSWEARRALLEKQLLQYSPDFICLQEVSALSFEEDFDFLVKAGYGALMHQKKGRMRPATFWREDRWRSIVAQHKDRTLVVGFSRVSGSSAGQVLFTINTHHSAGPNAGRRLRQMHEALKTISKEVKKLDTDPKTVPVVVCGDFNAQGCTAVQELLITGEVTPEFREEIDRTENGQLTSKIKTHNLSPFADAAEMAFGPGKAPPTMLATNIDSKMIAEDGSMTPELLSALEEAFQSCCSEGRSQMSKTDIERYLLKVNRAIGRGSEYRFLQAVFEQKGEETLSHDDFVALNRAELSEGKFWSTEHDLRALIGRGLAAPENGPCELRFDYIYFTPASLSLLGVYEPLSEEQKRLIWGEPWEVLPNCWHPSDHLPVTATFRFS